MADRTQLQQVILNLVKNAIEAMVAGRTAIKTLRLVTTQDGNSVVTLSIQDTGPGLNPENASHVFDPFFTTKPSGMGLGFPFPRGLSKITAVNCGSPRPVQAALLLKSLCQV